METAPTIASPAVAERKSEFIKEDLEGSAYNQSWSGAKKKKKKKKKKTKNNGEEEVSDLKKSFISEIKGLRKSMQESTEVESDLFKGKLSEHEDNHKHVRGASHHSRCVRQLTLQIEMTKKRHSEVGNMEKALEKHKALAKKHGAKIKISEKEIKKEFEDSHMVEEINVAHFDRHYADEHVED